MKQEQIKKILINVATGLVVVGVFVAGYFVFRGDQEVVVPSSETVMTATVDSAAETVIIGAEIARMVKGLQALKSSVEESATVFRMPAFKNLEDFSVTVNPEPVGRTDPFVLPDWKIQAKLLEEATKKQAGQSGSIPTGSVVSQTKSGASSVGGFSGI